MSTSSKMHAECHCIKIPGGFLQTRDGTKQPTKDLSQADIFDTQGEAQTVLRSFADLMLPKNFGNHWTFRTTRARVLEGSK